MVDRYIYDPFYRAYRVNYNILDRRAAEGGRLRARDFTPTLALPLKGEGIVGRGRVVQFISEPPDTLMDRPVT